MRERKREGERGREMSQKGYSKERKTAKANGQINTRTHTQPRSHLFLHFKCFKSIESYVSRFIYGVNVREE